MREFKREKENAKEIEGERERLAGPRGRVAATASTRPKRFQAKREQLDRV